ncbi:MAG: hypothetical protein IKK21_10340 [Clostridia bacterium]|nr:hypothetical protein [Clostridia bacterium]
MRSKRVFALLAAIVLTAVTFTAHAALPWPNNMTQGQRELQSYVQRVNDNLAALGMPPVNSLFECYPFNATLGVTGMDDAEIPEGIELTFTLYGDSLNTLILRVNGADRFAAYAAACIQAASPNITTLQDAIKAPSAHVKAVQKDTGSTIEDTVDMLNGPSPRTYYAYYPNQYRDGVSWLQMTLVFPLTGFDEAGIAATPAPPAASSGNTENEGYFASDDYTHLEIFTTPTPEPDSAVYD